MDGIHQFKLAVGVLALGRQVRSTHHVRQVLCTAGNILHFYVIGQTSKENPLAGTLVPCEEVSFLSPQVACGQF